jgi:hypothetical protein
MAEETFVEIPQPLHRGHFSQPNSSRISMEESMKTELRSLTDVHPYDANPRTNDKAVDSVALSINEYGFRQPLVVDTDGVIICGHTRYKAAVKLGLEKVVNPRRRPARGRSAAPFTLPVAIAGHASFAAVRPHRGPKSGDCQGYPA